MRHNLIALLADLYNLFEIHPSKCVNYPGMEQQSGKSVCLITFWLLCYIIDLQEDEFVFLYYIYNLILGIIFLYNFVFCNNV